MMTPLGSARAAPALSPTTTRTNATKAAIRMMNLRTDVLLSTDMLGTRQNMGDTGQKAPSTCFHARDGGQRTPARHDHVRTSAADARLGAFLMID
jgi:hypothetical protein